MNIEGMFLFLVIGLLIVTVYVLLGCCAFFFQLPTPFKRKVPICKDPMVRLVASTAEYLESYRKGRERVEISYDDAVKIIQWLMYLYPEHTLEDILRAVALAIVNNPRVTAKEPVWRNITRNVDTIILAMELSKYDRADLYSTRLKYALKHKLEHVTKTASAK